MKTPPRLSETGLVKQILQYLGWKKNVFVWRQNTGGANYSYTNKAGKTKSYHVNFGFPGMADVIGLYKGRFLAIEAKVGKNKQQPPQKAFQDTIERYGGIYILAYELKDVADYFEEEDDN